MDAATVFGFVTGMSMIIMAMIYGGDALPLMQLPSLLITLGGTFAAVLIHFPLKKVFASFGIARNCFVTTLPEPSEVIARFRNLAAQVRREGSLSLESQAGSDTDSFMRVGLEMIVNGESKEMLKAALERELAAIEQRHAAGRRLFEMMGSAAPAWGMIGTLIGLMQMMRSLDDPRQIGSGLAMALSTTLYGAVFANLFCIPLAGKLEARHAEEFVVRQVMTEGFLALLEENTPNVLEERLRAWVPPNERTNSAETHTRAA